MVYILILPALLLLWLGYRQYRWVAHYSKAKKHFFLSNENLAYVFDVREKFHSAKLLALAVFLVLYTLVFENLVTLEHSQADLMSCVFIAVLIVLCLVVFAIQSKSEKNFNLVLAKVQDFRANSSVSEVQKHQILESYVSAKVIFMIFSAIYSALNLSIFFLV